MASPLMGRIAEWYDPLRRDIYKLCEALRFDPNPHQKRLFNAVMRARYGLGPRQIAAKSGQGTGKTAGSCVVYLWQLLQAPNALVLLSAPTMRQCTEVSLTEFRRILEPADPLLKKAVTITNTRAYLFGRKEWGIKTLTATRSENFQGWHEPNMSIIIEEASGMSREILEAAKGTASNPNCLFLQIGNPNTRECAFFDCFHSQKASWECLTFSCEGMPKTEWFDPARNDRIADEYGKDSDVYRVRVLGEFPHTDPQCVISSEDVEAAFDVGRTNAALAACDERQIGLDFARYGGDENTVYARRGHAIVDRWFGMNVDPNVAVERAFKMQSDMEWSNAQCTFVADAGGMGQGVLRQFYSAGKRVCEFHNGGTSTKPDFANKVSEAYFHLGKLLRSKQGFLGRSDPRLVAQLSNRRYYTDKKGKLILEPKDEYLKRFEDSPDRADAMALTFYPHAQAGGRVHFADRGTG